MVLSVAWTDGLEKIRFRVVDLDQFAGLSDPGEVEEGRAVGDAVAACCMLWVTMTIVSAP
ncbi:hypothetical protein GCM10020221_20620 [Streptomyces thioluteus]|uniref:Uncharacterized protein n=1 Tax=Streptomyces thioluteus TaxID=66431 RepID=A0ABN3WT12_STRTU